MHCCTRYKEAHQTWLLSSNIQKTKMPQAPGPLIYPLVIQLVYNDQSKLFPIFCKLYFHNLLVSIKLKPIHSLLTFSDVFQRFTKFPKTFLGDLAISFGLITPCVPIYFSVQQACSELPTSKWAVWGKHKEMERPIDLEPESRVIILVLILLCDLRQL